mgnify:CR=1 FL=1
MVYVERRKGKDSFRMLADAILELHEMADFIGIPRSRFKASPPAIVQHYLLPAAVAKKALDTFGTPEFRTLLNESGLGNHPEMIRMMFRAGKAISEDKFVPAGSGSPKGAKDAANALYPNQQR